VDNDEVIPDYTIIYDSGSRRIDNSGVEDLKMEMVSRQAAVLKRLIPTNLAKWQ
jgi:dynactin-6